MYPALWENKNLIVTCAVLKTVVAKNPMKLRYAISVSVHMKLLAEYYLGFPRVNDYYWRRSQRRRNRGKWHRRCREVNDVAFFRKLLLLKLHTHFFSVSCRAVGATCWLGLKKKNFFFCFTIIVYLNYDLKTGHYRYRNQNYTGLGAQRTRKKNLRW